MGTSKSNLMLMQTLVVTLNALAIGCAAKTRLLVQSNPDKAAVFLRAAGAAEAKSVGETPLTLEAAKLPPELKSGPVYLEIRKDGFRSSELLITEVMGLNTTVTRQLEAVKVEEPKEQTKDAPDVGPLVDELFEAQRLIRVGRLDEALKSLEQIRTKNPSLAAVYEMQGGVYYLQHKASEALDAYRLAKKFNPGNADSVRMVAILESGLGVKPAAAAQPNAEAPK